MNTRNGDFSKIFQCGMITICDAGVYTVINIFIVAYFLAHYPPAWLSYLYMVEAIVPATALYFLNQYIKNRKGKSSGVSILSVNLILMFFATVFQDIAMYWLPFVISTFLATSLEVQRITNSNTISAALTFHQFKQNLQFYNFLRSTTGIVFGIIVSLVAIFIGSASIMVLLTVLTGLALFFTYRLPQIQPIEGKIKLQSHSSPFANPHFLYLALFMCSIEFLMISGDYVFEYTLGHKFNEDQISTFLGIFSTLNDVLWLLLSGFAATPVLSAFGLKGCLAILPIGYLISVFPVMADMNLITVTILSAVSWGLKNCFHEMGYELGMNVLMQSIRERGKVFMKVMICLVSFGSGSVIWFNNLLGLPAQAILVAGSLMSIFALYLLNKISKNYLCELAKSVTFKRYNPELLALSGTSEALMDRTFTTSIIKENPDNLQFALGVLSKFIKEAPSAILQILHSENKQMRLLVAGYLLKWKQKNSENDIFDQLQIEKDPEVMGCLIENMALFNPKRALPIAEKLSFSSDSYILRGVLPILIEEGTPVIKESAISKLNMLLESNDSSNRKNACRILSFLHQENFHHSLLKLLHDPSPEVTSSAIEVAWERNEINLLPEIASMLATTSSRRSAAKVLIKFGPPSIDCVEPLLHRPEWRGLVDAIEVLAGIESEKAQNILLRSYRSFSPIIQYHTVKKLSFYRLRKNILLPIREEAHNHSLYEFATMELLEKTYHAYEDPFLRNEINLRMQLALKRCLHWIAIYTADSRVLELMPSLIASEKTPVTEHNRAVTQELLENLIEDRSLKTKLSKLDDLQNFELTSNTKPSVVELNDEWLQFLIENGDTIKQGQIRDENFYPLALRKTRLFTDLQPEILIQSAKEATVLDMKEKSVIFKEGEPSKGLYIIISGQVDIILESHGMVLSNLKENDFFGELGMLNKTVRTSSAIAKTDCKLFLFSAELFEDLVRIAPELLHALIRIIIQYLKRNLEIDLLHKISQS